MKRYTVKIIQDYCVCTNDLDYLKGQMIVVTDLGDFKESYAIYSCLDGRNILDWIPKNHVQLI